MVSVERRLIGVVVVVAVIILGGVAWVFVQSRASYSENVFFTYNGFDFLKVPHGWRVEVFINQQGTPRFFSVREDPRELEGIGFDERVKDSILKKQKVYGVVDPSANLTGRTTMALLEIENVVDNPFLYNIPVDGGLTKSKEGSALEVKSCADVNETIGVIEFRVSGVSQVRDKDGCVIIEAAAEDDMVKVADRLVLTLLGVMRP